MLQVASVTLTADDLGGIWSGPGVSGNTFNPGIAGVGDHMIRYEIANQYCSDSDAIIVTVVAVPVITIAPVRTVYINSPPLTLSATPDGGIWSGEGVMEMFFDPTEAGLGIHVIQYETIPDR